MAITLSINSPTGYSPGTALGTLALDSSYTTGGYTIDASAFGGGRFRYFDAKTTGTYLFVTGYSTVEPQSITLKVYVSSTGLEVAAATNLSAVTGVNFEARFI